MTIDEAIEILEYHKDQPRPKRMSAAWRAEFDAFDRALDMAIEALKLEKSYYDEMAEVKSIAKGDKYEQT